MDFLPINKIQVFAIFGSIMMLVFIIELIRRKKIREEYGILWLISGGVFLTFSIWQEGLNFFSKLVGISYPPSFLLLVLIVALFGIMIHYSAVITKLTDRNKILVQELSLLKREVEEIKKNQRINPKIEKNKD